MAYNYSKLDKIKAKDNVNYFLDANIWLKVLNPKRNPSTKDKAYVNFVDSIRNNTKSKIVVPSLVLSEVINRIIREVHFQKHIDKIKKTKPKFKPSPDYYKKHFRSSEEYRAAYISLCNDIKNHHKSITLINDGLGSDFKFKHILKNPPTGLDFNDFLYYNICKKNNYTLVTDDKDFWVEDVKILTQSDFLYNKYKKYIARKKQESKLNK